jgi:hypothetical protein
MIARNMLTATGLVLSVAVTACERAPSSPLAGELAPTAPAASKTQNGRGGELHITKDCSQYTGKIGDFCTIIASNVKAIQPGTRVYYLSPLNFTDPSGLITLDSDVRLIARGGVAVGHCILTDAARTIGSCQFSGGTGRFERFSAKAAVTGDANPVLAHWDGWYQFASDRDRED